MRRGIGDVYGVSTAKRPWADAPGERRRDGEPLLHRTDYDEIQTCLHCELSGCVAESEFCPLHRVKRKKRTTRKGKADKRQQESKESIEKKEKIYKLVMNGGTDTWIARELGMDVVTVRYWKDKLRREGRLY